MCIFTVLYFYYYYDISICVCLLCQAGFTPLMVVQNYQVGQGDRVGFMRLLLDYGADVNSVSKVCFIYLT